ncbi:hypothetical protein [Demequina sp.]|uniref:hypothetical protein n=1 Tax=Demequina sp. TaxID=2050685 RepID=UPI003A84691B
MSEEEPSRESANRLRLTGGRFEGPGFPLGSLTELVNYEKIVLETAKYLWLRQHPDRKRVPKGFAQAVSLDLVSFEPGSKVPVLARPSVSEATLDFEPVTVLDHAQDIVDGAFWAIVEENRLPADFPPELARLFLGLGKTLRPNEGIEFSSAGEPGHRPKYTKEVRRRFLAAVHAQDFQDSGIVVGQITGVYRTSRKVEFKQLNGVTIYAEYSNDALTDDFVAVMDSQESAAYVRLDCDYTVSADNRISAIDDIGSVEVFLAQDDSATTGRLLELWTLDDGWLDGDGLAPDVVAIELARDLVASCVSRGMAIPKLFPLEDGSIQAQWITATDVWTAVLEGTPLIRADYFEVATDHAVELESTDVDVVADFFVSRRDSA